MHRKLNVIILLLAAVLSLTAQTASAQQPDLIAVKTNNTGGMGIVGTPFTWSIQVSNIGTGNYFINGSFSILRDELPNTNITYGTPVISGTSGITGAFGCNINNFRLDCSDNSAFTIMPGGTFTVSFTATPSAAGTFVNPRPGSICRADAGNENTESNESNNDCTDTVIVTTGATGPDLTVVKNNSVSGVTELANGAFNWSLNAANGGDADAIFSSGDLILTDNLPNTGVSYGTPVVSGQSGISGSGSIGCSIVSFNLSCTASGGGISIAAASGAFTVTIPSTPSVAGSLFNPRAAGTCAIDPDGNIAEGDETNNSCSDTVTVNGSPDMIAVKANDILGMGTVGTPFTWSIQVSNIGSANYFVNGGFNFFRDELPNTNISYGSPVVSGITGITGAFSCSINASSILNCTDNSALTIAPGGGFTVSFTATPSAASTFDNPRAGGVCRADFGNEDQESNESNNECSDTVVVGTGITGPDLTVVKNNSVGGVTELAAGAFNWSLTVTNGGDTDATFSSGQVILNDSLPDTNTNFGAPVIGSQTGISGGGSISCSIVSFNLVCAASSGSVTIASTSGSFTVTVPVVPLSAGTLINPRVSGSCSVDPDGNISEGDETNNSCADSVVVNGSPDLIAVKTNDAGGVAMVGTPFTWSIQVSNIGSANYFVNGGFNFLRDELPDSGISYGAVIVSAMTGISGTFSCSINASFILNCTDNTAVTIAPGGGFTVSFSATPSAPAGFVNPRPGGVCRADFGNEDLETNETNNDCSDSVSVSSADIAVSVDDGVTTAVPGQSVTYTIIASNNGPDADPAVSLADNFPATLSCNYTSIAAGGAGGNTAAGSGDLAETLTMPAGSSVTYTASCDIDSSATGTLSNTAIVSESLFDPVAANNSSTDNNTALTPQADIAVTKSDGVTTAVPGQSTLTYSIGVTNNGPSDDPSVTLNDVFPSVLTCSFTSTANAGATGNTAAGNGNLAEPLSMPAGSSVNYTASCDIDSSATGTLSNTVTAVASVTDNTPGNNSATDNDTVLTPEADIAVSKDDGVTTAVPGITVLTYTITVSNNGPSDDPAVSLVDNFPSELSCTFTSVAGGGATGNTAAGSDDLTEVLNMPVSSSVTYTVTCDIDPAATGTLSNTATASASVTDPVSGNNSAIDNDTQLTPEADVSVTKDDALTIAIPGDTTVIYTIVVANDGPSADPAVTLTDTLPAELSCTFTSTTSGGASGNTAGGSGDLSETLDMPVGGMVSYNVSCDIDPSATGTLSNTAVVAASVTDPDSGNNMATDDDTVLEPEADLSVSKVDDADPVVAGSTLIYTITVDNPGPSDAVNVVVSDSLPGEVTLISTTGCNEDPSGAPTCTLGTIPSGGSASYMLEVMVDLNFDGVLSNTATVSADTSDPDSSDNSTTETTTITPAESDLVLTISSNAIPPIQLGEVIDITLEVNNAGPGNNTGVTVNAELSSGLALFNPGPVIEGGNCVTANGSMITFDIGSLANGDSANCIFAVEIILSGDQSIMANVSGDITDPVPNNNADLTGFVVEIIDVPILSPWGLLILTLILLAAAAWSLHFRR